MQIERHLKRLLPKENFKDNSKTKPTPDITAPGRTTARANSSASAGLAEQGMTRSGGNAGLETGNNFHGMPQTGMELRAPSESAFDHGIVEGAYPIYMDEAQVQLLKLSGPTAITFDLATWTPRKYDSDADHGIDVACTLIIEKGADALTLAVDYCSPYGAVPDLSAAGYYEIGIAIVRVGTRRIVRAFPAIRPAPPEA